MPPSSTAPSSVQVSFYDSNGTENTNYSGQMNDSRKEFDIQVFGDSSNVLNAQVYIDSAVATNTASLKTFQLKLGSRNDFVETEQAYSGMGGSYSFVESSTYAVKVKLVLNSTGYPALYARFSIAGGAETPSYKFIYRTVADTLTPSVENVDEIQTNSTIKIAAPMVFPDSSDSRRPKDMSFTFDAYESLEDTDNLEALNSYTVTTEYKSLGKYELEDNRLQNDNKYALTVTAVYADGHSISKNVAEPVYVVPKPIINQTTSQAYGLGAENLDADVLSTSTVAVIILEAGSTPTNILLYDQKVTFDFKQGTNLCYQIEMPANSTTNSYTVLSTDPLFTKKYTDVIPVQNNDASGTYTFDVYASVKYVKPGSSEGYFEKTSLPWTHNFTYDIVPLSAVTIENAWFNAAVTTVNNKLIVENSNTLSITGFNKAQKLGITGKFSKTAFFGSGNHGTFKDLDTADTQFMFELSVNGGASALVPKIALMQGTITGGVKDSDQQNYVSLLDVNTVVTQGGKVDNLPYATAVPGQDQPEIYFYIPNNNNILFKQTDNVYITVSISSKTKGITLPAGTTSNSITMVNKIKEYSMTLDSASEPYMTGSGVNTKLTVPIDVSTDIVTGDFYLNSVRFYSTLNAPNNDVTVANSNSGKFDIVLSNVTPVSNNCAYRVAYIVDYPDNGLVEGPSVAETYEIPLSDEATAADNLVVSNYAYATFADAMGAKTSSFSFDIEFKDVTEDGRLSRPDGAHVYFKYGTNDKLLVKTIKKGDGDIQTNINVVLQSTPSTSTETSIWVSGLGGVGSVQWDNWTSATIIIKAYKTPKVISANDLPQIDSVDSVDNLIFNIPSIPAPTNFKLNGGVKDLCSANATGARVNPTSAQWDDTLSAYGAVVTSSYVLMYSDSVNTTPVDKSGQIVEPSSGINVHPIDVETLPAGTEYILTLLIKLDGANGYTWEGIPQIMKFNSLQVDQSSWNVTINRGSSVGANPGDANTLVAYLASNYPVGLNIAERKLCNNTVSNNENPNNVNVYTLNNIGKDTLQHIGPTIFNTYNLLDQTPAYSRGATLELQLRTMVGLNYTLQTPPLAPVPKESSSWYLSLLAPIKPYTTAGRPQLTITDGYTVQNNNIVVNFKVDAVGLENQGLSGVTAVVAQDSDLTDPNDPMFGNGGSMIVAFGPDANYNSPIEGISSINDVTTILNTVDMNKVKAGSLLAATVIPNVNGLNITNGAATNSVFPKINYYYYGNIATSQNSNNSFTLSNLTDLGLYAVFDNNKGAKQIPFLMVYTSRQSSGNMESWYSSKVMYAYQPSGAVWTSAPEGMTLIYTGIDHGTFMSHIKNRIKYDISSQYSALNTTNGPNGYLNEYVNFLTIQTSSNGANDALSAGDYNFRLTETGAVTNHPAFNKIWLQYHVISANKSDNSVTPHNTYGDAVNADPNNALDNLAANESRTTNPENLTDIFGAIETSVCKLDLGSLTSTDASKLSFSSDGFDSTRDLVVVMTASSARGTSVSVKTLVKQTN